MNATMRPWWAAHVPTGLAALLGVFVLIQQGRLAGQVAQLKEALARKDPVVSQVFDVDDAVKLGSESIRQGEWDVGQLYLVNAVTNAPRETRVIEEYANAVLKRQDAPPDALERLRSLLELATYQVPPRDIPRLQGLLNNTIKAIETFQARGDAGPADGPPAAQEWARLKVDDGTLAALAKEPGKLEEREQDLTDLLETLNGSADPQAKALADEVRQAHAGVAETAQALRLAGYIDQCLKKLDRAVPLTSDRAVAVAQAAENALNGSWMIATDKIPPELARQITEGYPRVIREKVDAIARARSEQVLAQVELALSQPSPPATGAGGAQASQKLGEIEKQCRDLQARLEKAQMMTLSITSDEVRKAAGGRLRAAAEALQQKRKGQYDTYQRWVIKLCSDTFNKYMTYKTVSSGEAIDEFKSSGLAEVDQSLLSPEAGRLFNDVTQKWLSRMNPVPLVQSEIKMSSGSKKKLEEF